MDTEKSTDSDIQAVVNAISGGDNVAAQASFDQIMQTKRDAALDVKKAELAAAQNHLVVVGELDSIYINDDDDEHINTLPKEEDRILH